MFFSLIFLRFLPLPLLLLLSSSGSDSGSVLFFSLLLFQRGRERKKGETVWDLDGVSGVGLLGL